MRIKRGQQIEFSSILFDTLFGLILYFSIDSFLDIKNPLHFIFYLFSIIVLVHRRISFKAADDAFDEEVTDSGLDLIIGIIQLVLIEYIVLSARSAEYITTGRFLIVLLTLDIVRTIVRRYVGKRHTTKKEKIKTMEKELHNNLIIDSIALVVFLIFVLLSPLLSALTFVIGFIGLYIGYIILSFRYKIIDIDIF